MMRSALQSYVRQNAVRLDSGHYSMTACTNGKAQALHSVLIFLFAFFLPCQFFTLSHSLSLSVSVPLSVSVS